jgi:hypothetical protein
MNYTLYQVQSNELNIMFNKGTNLIYGKFLKKLLDDNKTIKIIAYKTPSFIKKVDYAQLVKDLFETEISKDPHENKQLQKITANTVYGLLEKSVNKNSKSRNFTDLPTARHYQSEFGGDIVVIKEFKEETFKEVHPFR